MSQTLTTQSGAKDLRSLLKSDTVREQIALALPKHMDADRMARVALTACNKTPNLLKCDTTSVLTALMTCSACGIEPDGRNAHLIPYGTTCQLIIDFKGYVILAKRNGLKNIFGDVVCQNDTFEWNRDESGLHFNHEYDFKKPRGEMYAAYVIWNEASGDFCGEIMQKEEIDAIRKRSRSSGSGPWVSDYNEMAKKTVIRRASKKWDITPEIRDAIEADDQSFERDVSPEATAKPSIIKKAKEPEVSEVEIVPPATEEGDSEDHRQALFNTLAEAMEEDGIKPSDVQKWAHKNKIIESDKLALSGLPAEQLRILVERWPDIKSA